MSTGLEITKFSGKFMFLTMYQLWDNSWSWKHEFSRGKVRFPTCTKDSRKYYEINRWADRAKAFHIPHVIPHVRFYITAATTSAGQNTNRMHRLLFDTSTSWSSIKFTLSKNNCEREYWLGAGITNGRGADEMHDRATSRPISSIEKMFFGRIFYHTLKHATYDKQ